MKTINIALAADNNYAQHVAVVMVTHDQNLASKCDKIYKMIDGEIDA